MLSSSIDSRKRSDKASLWGILYVLPGVVSWVYMIFSDSLAGVPLFLDLLLLACTLYTPIAAFFCVVVTNLKVWQKCLVVLVNLSAFIVGWVLPGTAQIAGAF